MSKQQKIALIGNPNTGKSSVFNHLTGMRQKVGNFPGVTVERKNGILKLDGSTGISVTDLPGTYSLFPTSLDERIVLNVLTNPADKDFPDAVVYIADINHLERHSLLLSQIIDLKFPIVLALNMNDIATQNGITVDIKRLSALYDLPIVMVDGRTGSGIPELKDELKAVLRTQKSSTVSFHAFSEKETSLVAEVEKITGNTNPYACLLMAHQYQKLPFLNVQQKTAVAKSTQAHQLNSLDSQLGEIMNRYDQFIPILNKVLDQKIVTGHSFTDKMDVLLTHRTAGPLIFFGILLFIFQAIFSWSILPMDFIDLQFSNLSYYIQQHFESNVWTKLLSEGIIPGVSGVLVFVPQIFLLFLLITLLEEIGYMSRAVFMFDKIMQKFGLNGRSIVTLISGGACAVPAIMSTRTISNWKERIITILVTPFISCSARIPVFAILIGFVVPKITVFGFLNAQGLVFMSLYLTGVVTALAAAFILKKLIKTDEHSFLMLELPEYKMPHWKNVFFNVYEKVKSFVLGAGKIILVVSILLWFLASFGPSLKLKEAENIARIESALLHYDTKTTDLHIAAKRLEASYAGMMGRVIEPVIRPLGFDWKIGIALITSFAAREVFVGTISTLYSIGKDADNLTIKQKLQNEKNDEGMPVFTMPVALSLILFYLFAMQCMSTLATVYRETKSWKWPAFQFVFMSGLAYTVSLLVFQVLK
ncbi:MAG: ferrous iron transport protein B [Sphingobacteriales bacterium]|nr:ferrous iron transport protein B [Sphingobacteriales bacterium]